MYSSVVSIVVVIYTADNQLLSNWCLFYFLQCIILCALHLRVLYVLKNIDRYTLGRSGSYLHPLGGGLIVCDNPGCIYNRQSPLYITGSVDCYLYFREL